MPKKNEVQQLTRDRSVPVSEYTLGEVLGQKVRDLERELEVAGSHPVMPAPHTGGPGRW